MIPPNLPTTNLPRQYNFILNPYPDSRLSTCPFCGKKTGQRKLPLVIHIEPRQLLALNITCRYCPACDLLIAHKHAVESLMTDTVLQHNLPLIGNDYLIIGTVEKKVWQESMKIPMEPVALLAVLHPFLTVYNELRRTQAGYFRAGVTPPVEAPPPSQDWVKRPSPRQ